MSRIAEMKLSQFLKDAESVLFDSGYSAFVARIKGENFHPVLLKERRHEVERGEQFACGSYLWIPNPGVDRFPNFLGITNGLRVMAY